MNNYDFIGAKGTFWHLASGPKGGDKLPFKVRFKITGSGWTTDSTIVAYVHEARLRIKCRYLRDYRARSVGHKKAGRRGQLAYGGESGTGEQNLPKPVSTKQHTALTEFDNPQAIGMEVGGREFGSWITGRGGPASGDRIDEPEFVIESLLRDELDLVTTDIDTTSFDAINSTENCYIALEPGSAKDSKGLLERICWEHGLWLYRTPEGKLRIVKYDGGSVVATLTPHDLVGEVPQIRLGLVSNLINDLTIFYSPLPHSVDYAQSTTITDPTSDTAYGTFPGEVELETIRARYTDASQIDRFTKRMMKSNGSGDYLASRPHLFVDFPTIGPKFGGVQIGDKLKVNSDFDARMLLMGNSWGANEFTVYATEATERDVLLRTILWTPPTI
jgi:hypothetical protein